MHAQLFLPFPINNTFLFKQLYSLSDIFIKDDLLCVNDLARRREKEWKRIREINEKELIDIEDRIRNPLNEKSNEPPPFPLPLPVRSIWSGLHYVDSDVCRRTNAIPVFNCFLYQTQA